MKPFLFAALGIASIVSTAAVTTPRAYADTTYQQSNQTGDSIRVNVDGTPVAFTGVQAIENQGAVLVPLRGVFEAMGAYVDYDTATHMITASKGDRTVTLPLGATEATVNGQSQSLSQPAKVVQGTTLVPLRFVAEALGANVTWVSDRNMVRIQTAGSPIASTPAPSEDRITGVARRVSLTPDSRKITIDVDGVAKVFPVSDTTTILRRTPGQPPVDIALSQITRGDRVSVHQDEYGVATRITAMYAVRQGTVSSVGALANGNTAIVFENGDTVALAPRTFVTKNGARVELSQIAPYDRVTIHTDPNNSLGYSVVIGQNLRAHRRN